MRKSRALGAPRYEILVFLLKAAEDKILVCEGGGVLERGLLVIRR
jgi:hypothetical protein